MSGDIIQLNPEAFQTELKGLVKNSIGLIHISLSLYYFAVIMMFHLVKPFHFLWQCCIMFWYLLLILAGLLGIAFFGAKTRS